MKLRELLETLSPKCPLCGGEITRDEDGCPQCAACLQKCRDSEDYELMAEFWGKADHIETWILDKRRLDQEISLVETKLRKETK